MIEQQLSDGRTFLLGDTPDWVDIGAYFNIWMARSNIPSAARMFKRFEHMQIWTEKMHSFGEGAREEISAEAALEIARSAEPNAPVKPSSDDESGATPGDTVTVTPTDHGKVPVKGVLTAISDEEIVIRRSSARAGAVAVHFPRLGYRVDHAD